MDWRRFVSEPEIGSATFAFEAAHTGLSVLVTGAGGSLGSALAKALARSGVDRLVLLDSSEVSLFELQMRLAATSNAALEFVLGNIDDASLLDSLFDRQRVDLIYHAAAWKQVPLLESNPFSAVRNNTLGTYTLAQAAIRGGVSKLVLISTDKAVNPRSILGVSKRIAELVVVSLSGAACGMNAIRLCNVIGSSGSVMPIFLRQIADRQPLAITDPEASRWFLTIREAVDTILAGGISPQHGVILVPRVGPPVRIAELARFLIRSAGEGWPGELVYAGLRPGDKLTEELFSESERKLGMERCLTIVETPRLEAWELKATIDAMDGLIARRDLPGLLRSLTCAVPEYVPSKHVLEQAAVATYA